jgi:hypothetical protein
VADTMRQNRNLFATITSGFSMRICEKLADGSLRAFPPPRKRRGMQATPSRSGLQLRFLPLPLAGHFRRRSFETCPKIRNPFGLTGPAWRQSVL